MKHSLLRLDQSFIVYSKCHCVTCLFIWYYALFDEVGLISLCEKSSTIKNGLNELHSNLFWIVFMIPCGEDVGRNEVV
jgi:hypothetical protein